MTGNRTPHARRLRSWRDRVTGPRLAAPMTAVSLPQAPTAPIPPGTPPPGTRCVAYVSVGSDAVPFSRSVEQQAAIHAYASAHGLDVIDLGCDIVSGDASLGERHGLQALVRDAPALGATHLIVQDRSRIDGVDGVDVTDGTGEPAPVLSGLVVIEAEPAHLFRGYREPLLDPPLAWPFHLLSTRVDSRRISRMVTGQEAK